ncbi:hypothetical protein TB1_008620 [Malus domestica]
MRRRKDAGVRGEETGERAAFGQLAETQGLGVWEDRERALPFGQREAAGRKNDKVLSREDQVCREERDRVHEEVVTRGRTGAALWQQLTQSRELSARGRQADAADHLLSVYSL